MNKFNLIILLFFFFYSSLSFSTEDVIGGVTRSITSMGCHINSSTCYIYVDEAVGKQGECFSTSIRWYSDSVNAKEVFSLFMAAKMANKQVSINVSSNCFSGGGSYPTFNYMSIR